MKLKIFLVGSVIALTLGLFTACGGSPTIDDASSLVEANKAAQEAVTSYHMDSDMDMNIAMGMEGLESLLGTSSLSMPMDMKMAMDMGKESAHGTTSVSISMMGQKQDVNAEMYVDIKEGVAYSKLDGADTWTKSEQDAASMDMAGSVSEMSEDILSKAKFESDDDSYELTLTAADLGESISDLGLMDNLGSSGVELKDFSMTEGEVKYTFDKDKVLLRKVSMDDVKIKATGSMQGTTMDMDITMEADYELGKYDELDPKDYQIPDEVKKGSSGQTTAATKATEATEATKATEATEATKGELLKSET